MELTVGFGKPIMDKQWFVVHLFMVHLQRVSIKTSLTFININTAPAMCC